MGVDSDKKILEEAGLDVQAPDTGCCGLAGSFGYEQQHYDVSMKVGQLMLLPAIRTAPRDELIVADGFSCRCQTEHGSDRRALHLAEVLSMALKSQGDAESKPFPEIGHVQERPPVLSKRAAATIAAGGLVAAGALGWLAWRKLARNVT